MVMGVTIFRSIGGILMLVCFFSFIFTLFTPKVKGGDRIAWLFLELAFFWIGTILIRFPK